MEAFLCGHGSCFLHFFFSSTCLCCYEDLWKMSPCTQIADGVFVGGWPSSVEHLPPGDPAVIDCTCELPKSSTLSNNAYLCVATWDTRAPQPSQIESAVRWAIRKRSQNKPVYVHCAYGNFISSFLLWIRNYIVFPYVFLTRKHLYPCPWMHFYLLSSPTCRRAAYHCIIGQGRVIHRLTHTRM